MYDLLKNDLSNVKIVHVMNYDYLPEYMIVPPSQASLVSDLIQIASYELLTVQARSLHRNLFVFNVANLYTFNLNNLKSNTESLPLN